MKVSDAMIYVGCAIVIASCAAQIVPKTATATATTGAAREAPKDFCSVAQPIRIAKGDKITPGTADQIIAHNRRGQKLCGWKP